MARQPAEPLTAVRLPGLDGGNPLAFLAAVGALRLADRAYHGQARLSWERAGRWTPVLHVPAGVTREGLVGRLYSATRCVGELTHGQRADELLGEYRKLRPAAEAADKELKKECKKQSLSPKMYEDARRELPAVQAAEAAQAAWQSLAAPFLMVGKSLSVLGETFRCRLAVPVAERVGPGGSAVRGYADFVSAFGCEACTDEDGFIVPTEFQLTTGSGHQYFLGTYEALMDTVTPPQLDRALFGPWNRADSGNSFRWDPQDDRRYAFRWDDPGPAGVISEHGANLLAGLGLPLFPVFPVRGGAATTGFVKTGGTVTFTWPLWRLARSVDVVRSLIGQFNSNDPRERQRGATAVGVCEVLQLRKIRVGSGANVKLNLTAGVPV